jgi:hypothetical protein
MGRGCPIPLPGTYTFTVSSTPSGARVYLNGKYKGTTPLSWDRHLLLQTIETIELKASLDGYEDGIVSGNNYAAEPARADNAEVEKWGTTTHVAFDLPRRGGVAALRERTPSEQHAAAVPADRGGPTGQEPAPDRGGQRAGATEEREAAAEAASEKPVSLPDWAEHRWQVDPGAFAKLFFGEDLSVKRPAKGVAFLKRPAIKDEVMGCRVEWPAIYGIDPFWLGLNEEQRVEFSAISENPRIYAFWGPDSPGLTWLMDGSRREDGTKVHWREMTWGIPPQSDVVVRMKLTTVKPWVDENGLQVIYVCGEDLHVETSAERCDWPEYASDFAEPIPNLSGYSGAEVRVVSDSMFPVKVGLRSGTKGCDFIVPPEGSACALVPGGRYDIYFQYATDPGSLYQGDSFGVKAGKRATVRLRKTVDGNYRIRRAG